MTATLTHTDMSVGGVTIPAQAQEMACAIFLRKIEGRSKTTIQTLKNALGTRGVPHEQQERAADRLLQKMRKANIVKFEKGAWVAVEGNT